MKKTVMFLSALAMTASVYAADKFEAGTADAPNYYVLKAGRGTPYLAYYYDANDSEARLTTGNGEEVNLYRTDNLSQENIWVVIPGEAEGTVKVIAYPTYGANNRGLMNFLKGESASTLSGAVATCVKAKDIYPTYNANGTVSLSINTAEGYIKTEVTGADPVYDYYTLDASNGSNFCGNWVPGDAGTSWTAYKLDLTNGVDAALAAVDAAIVKEAAQALVEQYIGFFQTYIESVPWVAEELQAGVDALKGYDPTANYSADVDSIWALYTSNASAALNTMFAGKQIAVQNLRRANGGKTAYPAADAAAGNFPMVDSYTSNPAAVFILESAEEGYYFYNENQKVFIGLDASGNVITVDAKENAHAIKFLLNANGGFVGVNMLLPGVTDMSAINADNNASSKLVLWYAADGGSIWAIYDASEEAQVKDAIAANLANLEAYAASVPDMVANILNIAIDNIKALNPAETTAAAVNEIADKAMADANNLLLTGMNGIKLTLRNLRQNKFVSVADGQWAYSEFNDVAETVFTFKAQEDGGYILYNEAGKLYIGNVEEETNAEGKVTQRNILGTDNEADAMTLYPFLSKGGNFTGVALSVEAEIKANCTAINTNTNTKILHTYSANDAGSIFALMAPDTVLAIDEVKAAGVKMQGIYDLSGRKLVAPVKGINIINGKKVLVK